MTGAHEQGRSLAAAARRCTLCPRGCGVNRTAGERGFCGAGNLPQVFRYGLHHGEEPPLSGSRGSGTIFLSRCTLRCLYCQNYPWSQQGAGREHTVPELAAMLRDLHQRGAHNWNWVSPTPWLPWLLAATAAVERDGMTLPVVYNTSGYESVATLQALEGRVAVYLTDLRYARPESAAAGSGAADYVAVARAALLEMWRQTGPLQTDADGIAVRGTICRLLVLPGRAAEAVANLRWLAEHVGTELAISLLAQYVPAYRAVERPPWNRPVTRRAYERVVAEAERLGFENGWVQDYDQPPPAGLVGFTMPAGGPERAATTAREAQVQK